MIPNAHVLAACALILPGGNLLVDGNFDGLTPGTPPNCTQPAGAWAWPANYATVCETDAAQKSIVATASFDPGATGNSMALSYSEFGGNIHLPNVMETTLSEDVDPLVRVQFDLFVMSGAGGGAFYVGGDHGGGGFSNASDRGPQVHFTGEGTIVCSNTTGAFVIIQDSYLFDAWQTVRLEIDLSSDSFDIWWAPQGDPLKLIGSDLPFRSGTIEDIDRFTVAHFGGTVPTVTSFVDNISVEIPGAANPGDLNGDGAVNVTDLLALIADWGPCDPSPAPCPADLDGSGTVNVTDLLLLIANWG